jgi:DNA ligase-1
VLREIADGEVVEVQGSASKPYQLKNTGGVYSCTCPAWRNQSLALDLRSCKHLQAVRGDAAETARVGAVNVVRAVKTPTSSQPVLLAQKYEPTQDPTGWWMSEKLDGVRAYWDGSQLISRLGNPFHAPDWFIADLSTEPLDGELWMGRGQFQQAVSVVRRQDKSDHWRQITYQVFDAPGATGPFEARLAHLRQLLTSPHADVVDHVACTGPTHLAAELLRVEALGGEGLMLRKPGSAYVAGRSSTLLKVKSFLDGEARVVGYTAGAGRHRGRVGALSAVLPDGTTFAVGTGLSDADREAPPAIGSIIHFRYQELTDTSVPRFPSFIGERADFAWPTGATAGTLPVGFEPVRLKRDRVVKRWTIRQDGEADQVVDTFKAALAEVSARAAPLSR